MSNSAKKLKEFNRISEIEFQKCQNHRSSLLNHTCVQDGCLLQFLPSCLLCQYDKKYTCSQHIIQPVNKVISDLENMIASESTFSSVNNHLTEEIDLLAKQFKNIGNKCLEVSENISMSASKYKKTATNLAPEVKGIENILDNIKQEGTAQNMRLNLSQLHQYVEVQQNGTFSVKLRNSDKLERLSSRFQQYYERLEQLYSYIINDLHSAHQNSVFYTGVQFSNPSSDKKGEREQKDKQLEQQIERMRVVMESPQKVGMRISDDSCFKVKIITKGDPNTYPLPKQKVKINYKVYDDEFNLLDQNKEGNPFVFTLGIGEVIKGWEQAIPEIALGEKALIVCHKNLINNSKYNKMYLDESSSLYFEIEILDII